MNKKNAINLKIIKSLKFCLTHTEKPYIIRTTQREQRLLICFICPYRLEA